MFEALLLRLKCLCDWLVCLFVDLFVWKLLFLYVMLVVVYELVLVWLLLDV